MDGHDGGGATGTNQIGAQIGDTLRLLITVHADANELLLASVSLAWQAGDQPDISTLLGLGLIAIGFSRRNAARGGPSAQP